MSAQAFGCLQRNGIGKELTTFGVDIQAAIPAPGDELGRVDVGAG